jgi:hypothetical protein
VDFPETTTREGSVTFLTGTPESLPLTFTGKNHLFYLAACIAALPFKVNLQIRSKSPDQTFVPSGCSVRYRFIGAR